MVRVTYIMNIIDRYPITKDVTEKNILYAGRGIDEFIFTDNGSTDKRIIQWAIGAADTLILNETNVGNPQALNNALKKAKGDYIVIAANKTEHSKGWLKTAIKVLEDNSIGLVSFGKAPNKRNSLNINGVDCEIDHNGTCGTWVMKRTTFEKVGYFSEWSKYGYWDGDYCERIRLAGLQDVYIPGVTKNKLIKTDPKGYKEMKTNEAKIAWDKKLEQRKLYSKDCYYLTKEQELNEQT